MFSVFVLGCKHNIISEYGGLSFGSYYVVDVSSVNNRPNAEALQDSCKNLSSSGEAIFNLGLKGLISEKRFDCFNNFDRNIKGSQFIEMAFVPNPVKGFLHVKKHRSILVVIVMVYIELVSDFGH